MATDISSALKGKKQGDIVTIIVKDEKGVTQTRNVYLRNDPEGENLADVIPSFTALGVSTIQKVQPTKNSSILENDYLWSINNGADEASGEVIYLTSDLVNYAKSLQVGETAEFYVRRSVDGKNQNVLITVPINDDISTYSSEAVLSYLGISSSKTYLKYSTKTIRFNFFESIGRGFGYSINVGGTIFRTLGELLTGKLGLNAMGGPITTISTTSESIRTGGLQYLLDIAGFIGVNLAVFNLLPLPALDGSRVVFCAIEWIRKKPVNRKIEAIIHAVGIVVLLGFSVLVDILQLF
jgi:RIP metalloprotease RseP